MAEEDRFSQLTELINKRFDNLQEDLTQTKFALSSYSARVNEDVSQMRRVVIDNLMKENRLLQKRVRGNEKRMIKLERQANMTEQNNRKNNIEIEGIPSSVQDNELRAVVADLLNRISAQEISTGDIEAVHRLFSKREPHPTIVRMKRNLLEEIRSKAAKEKLKGIGRTMGCLNGSKIYINDNLSPNMRNLAFQARLLKANNVITDTWFSNAAVRIRRKPGDRPIKIVHEEDLFLAFPDFDKFTFDRTFYQRIVEEDELCAYDELEGWDGSHCEEEEDSEEDEERPNANLATATEPRFDQTNGTSETQQSATEENAIPVEGAQGKTDGHQDPCLQSPPNITPSSVPAIATPRVDGLIDGTISGGSVDLSGGDPEMYGLPNLEKSYNWNNSPRRSMEKSAKGTRKKLSLSSKLPSMVMPPNLTRSVVKSKSLSLLS